MGNNKTAAIALSWLKQIILVIAATIIISVLVIQTYDINDVSMQPTFDSQGNRVLVFLTPYIFNATPDYGDIIIIDSRIDRQRTFIDRFKDSPVISILRREVNEYLWVKRVVGLPGDRVEYNDGRVYRNGEALEEDYISGEMNKGFAPVIVPEGYVYVMGDNRNRSSDSRQIGPIPVTNIQGRVFLRFLPINKISLY